MRRSLRFAISLLLSPISLVAASVVTNADSTRCNSAASSSEPKTLLKGLGIAGAHYDLTAAVRLASGMGGIAQHRAMLSFCRWDTFSIGLTSGASGGLPFSTGEPIDAARRDPHRASVGLHGAELQWRFARLEAVHPLVSVSAGRMTATWHYSLATPPLGITRPSTDPRSSATYVATAFGGELNLFKYVRADIMGGVRAMSSLRTPGLAARPLQGPFLSSSLAFGKF
jgi:hypothetical protein